MTAPPHDVVDLVTQRGEELMYSGRPREARDWLTEHLPRLLRSGERAVLRRATNMLGGAHFALGDLNAARAAFERALELGQEDLDDLTIARATNNLAAIANVHGEYQKALALYQLAIPAYQRLGNALGLAQSMHNMAISYRDLEQYDQSDEGERRAIEYARQAGSGRLQAHAQLGRAEVFLRTGDPKLAEAGAKRASKAFEELQDPIERCGAERLVGVALLAQGRRGFAEIVLTEALASARRHGALLIEAETSRDLARLRLLEESTAAARELGESALAIFERLDARREASALRQWLKALE